jgi:hypothetical protein
VENGPAAATILPILVGIDIKIKTTSRIKNITSAGNIVL